MFLVKYDFASVTLSPKKRFHGEQVTLFCSYDTFVWSYRVKCFHMLYSHVSVMSSCSDLTWFWSLFHSFICRNHPFLLQRFWQTIRGYTRWGWLRRRWKAQPIWTLFPTVPFLNHHLMSTANVPYLPYTCPHFCSLPSTTTSRSFHFSLQSQIIFQGKMR